MRARLDVNPNRPIGPIDPNIYGQFLCRRRWVADEGLYDPAHPEADEHGLRKPVVEAIRESAPPIVRWPGGCTGTSYDWRHGVGPQERRPRTLDAHFGYDVGNGFGSAEFVQFCRRIGAEPQINLSTGFGSLREAFEWIEYCNYAGASQLADLRRQHGHDEPFNVRYWQIGNENYGPWEIGHHTAEQYAEIAFEWGKTIKKLGRDLKVIAVGGSQKSLFWDMTVLNKAWPVVDYLTAHRYWNFDPKSGDGNYDYIAAVGYAEEQIIKAIGGVIELVAREKKSPRKPKLAFTEWNVRNLGDKEMSNEWRPTQTQYRLADALAVAGFLNAMRRQCRIVGLGNFAQSVNVVGMLHVTPQHVIRETVYWALTMQRRHAAAMAVDAHCECEGYTVDYDGRTIPGVPYLDACAMADTETGRLVLSFVNRHKTDELTVEVVLRDAAIQGTGTRHELWHEDEQKRNSPGEPDAVSPKRQAVEIGGSKFELALKPHSLAIYELSMK